MGDRFDLVVLTLRETALFLSGYRQRDLYGVTVDVSPDLAVSKPIARKDAVRSLEVGRIRHNLERHGIEQVHGTARFLDAHSVGVSGNGVTRDLDGMVKLVFDRGTRKLLGCHCIGERATELVHVGQAVITLGGTVETFIEMVFNYPTLSESYKYAAYDALAGLGPLSPSPS